MDNEKNVSTGVQKRSGIKYIPFMGEDEDKVIVSLCEFQDNLYCATQKGVYILEKDKFERIELIEKDTNV